MRLHPGMIVMRRPTQFVVGIVAPIVLAVTLSACGGATNTPASSSPTASTATVATLGGTAGASGSADGTGAAARCAYPLYVACDAAGNLSVADTHNYTIRKITLTRWDADEDRVGHTRVTAGAQARRAEPGQAETVLLTAPPACDTVVRLPAQREEWSLSGPVRGLRSASCGPAPQRSPSSSARRCPSRSSTPSVQGRRSPGSERRRQRRLLGRPAMAASTSSRAAATRACWASSSSNSARRSRQRRRLATTS